ncbi:MAG: DEAD/DEAH box helicase family protein [Actinobacteria bacterium]|nr:DEAD/DEAH box helicase family protein [Actinomycetota bacterium]
MVNDGDMDELTVARAECARLRAENSRLRALLEPSEVGAEPMAEDRSLSPEATHPASALGQSEPVDAVTSRSPVAAKLALFQALFRGRDDVYAVRWQSKAGRSGYAPACAHEWNRAVCDKPKIKCADCPSRELLPITDEVIHDHLTGRHTIGVYPLLPDETCRFLALDFDKAEWRQDVAAFTGVCAEFDVPAYVEVSRSGDGAHVWLFFSERIEAARARRLGSALLTRTTAQRHEVGLDSYDRLFPSQDTLPKGGFGNLIALPLQRKPRDESKSVFVNTDFQTAPDQWQLLSRVVRMSAADVAGALEKALGGSDALGERIRLDDGTEAPWTLPPSGRHAEPPIPGPFPVATDVVSANLVYVSKDGLPQGLQDRLVRLAAFENPEFYRAQAMRLPTFAKPRLICCAEEIGGYIALPRGCLDAALDLLEARGIESRVRDERTDGQPLDVTFRGELTPQQLEAAEVILAHDNGVMCAATAFGKTVVGAWLIAARQVNTLVLVHRRQLMDQWRERLSAFLDLPPAAIGVIGGGRARATGAIDVAVIQSLNKKGVVADLVADYGHVIVDECHHLSAFSFEQVLKQVRARHVVGLTATPVRRDGHHPIITMQCGPIRYCTDAKSQAAARPFAHRVITRETDFAMPAADADPGIQAIYSALAADSVRNELIITDVLAAVAAGRSPLVLTERTEHRDVLAELSRSAATVFTMSGGMGAKTRRAIAEEMAALGPEAPRVIVATGRCVGEGFDDARLDTLFLAMPVAWRGTLQQYAGRLHREHAGKVDVLIYDYVDSGVPVLARMHQKRLSGYRAMGYAVTSGPSPSPACP